jgi:hypothetical protein
MFLFGRLIKTMEKLKFIKILYYLLLHNIHKVKLYIEQSRKFHLKWQWRVFVNTIFKRYNVYWSFFLFCLLKRYYYVLTVPTFFVQFPEVFNVLYNRVAIDSFYVFFCIVLFVFILISGVFIPRIDYNQGRKIMRMEIINQSEMLLQSETVAECPIVIDFLTFYVDCLMRCSINCFLGYVCISYAYKALKICLLQNNL